MSATPKVKVLFHNRCFDGVTSAALFSRFYTERIDPHVQLSYQGLVHKTGDPFPPDAFDGDVNAVVDFRYSRSPRLTWWFDHHLSAFPTPEDEADFRADRSDKKFFDPKAKSCSKFLADTVASRFGFDTGPLEELIRWADVIDSAGFRDAEEAVALEAPALQLMTAIENAPPEAEGDRFLERIIREITVRPLAELAEDPEVKKVIGPVLERHKKSLGLVRERARLEGGVVFFDLADQGVEGWNKFIPYAIYPDCRYVVSLSATDQRTKISVGSNPWPRTPRTHNISQICERYGGGGHAVVGAISLPPGQIERGREICREIVAELQG
jgi:hypothetical protein